MNKLTEDKIKAAIQDPAAMFASPEAVIAHPDLSEQDKRKILESWKVDATLLLTADEENMDRPEAVNTAAEKLREIAKAEGKV